MVAGFLLEILYGFYVLRVLGGSAEAYSVAGQSGVVVFMMIGGFWVGRKAQWRPAVQGGLVGLIANLLYLAVVLIEVNFIDGSGGVGPDEEIPVAFQFLNFVLKIIGGAVGGFIGSTAYPRRGAA